MSDTKIAELAYLGAKALRTQSYRTIWNLEKQFPGLKKEPIEGSQRLIGEAPAQKRAAKRTMTPAQRKAVSVRMKKYWAEKRKAAK